MGVRGTANPVRLSVARELGRPIDGAWWPRVDRITNELPQLVTLLTPMLGDITAMNVNWAPLQRPPDFNWSGWEHKRQHVITVSGGDASANLLIVPYGTYAALALMLLRCAANLPVDPADHQTGICDRLLDPAGRTPTTRSRRPLSPRIAAYPTWKKSHRDPIERAAPRVVPSTVDTQSQFDVIAQTMARGSSGVSFVLLDRDLRIQAASRAYEQVTLRERGELPGQFLFDAFPDNPHDPQANGTLNLAASLEAVMRSGDTHKMRIQRYDIPDPDSPGEFLPKVWRPTNFPLFDGGKLVGVAHRVDEVCKTGHLLSEIARAGEEAGRWTTAELLHTVGAISTAENAQHLERQRALVAEIEQLRCAVETRDVIGQAKGMLMERFDVDSLAAFNLLIRLSQNTNPRVERVARKLVEIDHPQRSS